MVRTRQVRAHPGWLKTHLYGWRRIASLLPLGCLVASLCLASEEVETRIKAAYVYNYARFIEWPGSESPKPITIVVIGQNEMQSALIETVRGKTIGGHPIQVRSASGFNELDPFQILVVERSEGRKVKNIAQAISGRPILLVCDSDNCLRDGGMIGFRIVEESVRFEINLEAAQRAGLKVSSQLLKVALPYTGKSK